MPIQNLDKLVTEMDSLNMAVMVNLSGFRGNYLEWSLDNVNEKYSDRFALFLNINFENNTLIEEIPRRSKMFMQHPRQLPDIVVGLSKQNHSMVDAIYLTN